MLLGWKRVGGEASIERRTGSDTARICKPVSALLSFGSPCFFALLMAADWGYEDHNGPDTWPSKYPQAGGSCQSPIDILSSVVKSGDFDIPLKWKYEPGICKSILNTGVGWRVDVDGSNTELSGGPLTSTYELVQFHCHWGDCNSCGSEHTVDGKPYAGELHFVHWNKDEFGSCAEAVPSPRGLTVIGVFVEIGEKNDEIEKLCEALENIPEKDQRFELQSDIDPSAMYPETYKEFGYRTKLTIIELLKTTNDNCWGCVFNSADHSFWTYSGSLTTPPCYESVTWIVFKNPINISEDQLSCFRQMKKPLCTECTNDSGFVEKNFRPPQPLNDREICEVLC